LSLPQLLFLHFSRPFLSRFWFQITAMTRDVRVPGTPGFGFLGWDVVDLGDSHPTLSLN